MTADTAWWSTTLESAKVAWDLSPALMVVTLGPEHVLAYQNPASARLFGVRTLGAPVEVAFPEMSAAARATLDALMAGDSAVSEPTPRPGVLGAAGEEVLLTYVFAPLAEADRPPWGVLLTAMDVTAEVKAARAALQAELLSELSERMNAADDPTEALRQLTRTLVPAVADLAAVFVVDSDEYGVPLRNRQGTTPRPASTPSALTISDGLLERVGLPPASTPDGQPSPWETPLAAGRSLLIDISGGDLAGRSDDAVRAWLDRAGASNIAVLPLSFAGQLAGAVVLLAASPRVPYDEADLPFLELTAVRAGSVVGHLRAFRQQWQIALELQHALLPAVPSGLPGVDIAARYVAGGRGVEIGGDWWDVADLGSGRVGVGLGDVSGRGVEAAVVMGHARAGMRAAGLAQLSPSAVLTLLDRQLADLLADPTRPEITMPARFATALYAVFDSHTDRLTLANAGHPPLLMRQPDGRVERVHAPPGAPLGLRAAGYEEISVPFPPGAVLVGFTDGLVETRQASLDSGLNQLHGRLASAATSNVEEIADVLLALNQDGPDLEDDIALVVLRRPTPTDEESASRDLP